MTARKPQREDFAHFTRLPVRWGDLDSLGHVNNAVFFTFDEQARLEYFEAAADVVDGLWSRQGLILARIGADFVKQLRYPATLEIGLRIARLGRSSMETEGAVFDQGELVAATQGVVVWFDYELQKPAPIPETLRQLIRMREKRAPLEA
jgi:acyl-CoA thioester hydrolase